QGRLYVTRLLVSAQALLHPVQVEVLAASAARRWQLEPGLIKQAPQQGLVDGAARGPSSAVVVAGSGMPFAPGVQQRVRGAGVEAAHSFGGVARKQGEVGNA